MGTERPVARLFFRARLPNLLARRHCRPSLEPWAHSHHDPNDQPFAESVDRTEICNEREHLGNNVIRRETMRTDALTRTSHCLSTKTSGARNTNILIGVRSLRIGSFRIHEAHCFFSQLDSSVVDVATYQRMGETLRAIMNRLKGIDDRSASCVRKHVVGSKPVGVSKSGCNHRYR